jgi:HlyD family secretion protein
LKSIVIRMIMAAMLSLGSFFGDPGSIAALETTAEKIPVKVTEVVRKDLSSTQSALGTVNYMTKAEVSSEIEGILRSVDVEEGDWVKAGQTVAVIDGSLLEARLKEAQAVLELEELNLPKWENEVKKLELKVEKSRIALQNYLDLFEAQKKLFKSGGISKSRLSHAEIDYQEALLEYNSALGDLKSLKTKSNQGRSEVEARIAKARADIEEIQTNLEKCTIKAPIAGVIAGKRKWTGERVSPNDAAIATILQVDPIFAEVEINEKRLAQINVDQQAEVTADAYPGMTFAGNVHAISPTIEPSSRTVRVKVKVPNERRLLKPGMFVRVNIFLDRLGETLVVPSEAFLKTEDGRKVVYVVIDDVAFMREVQTGERRENWVVVNAGVKAGEKVVIEGHEQLKNLSSVEVMESGTK